MDSYPGELLVGVFPLVFAVDAILRSPSSTPPAQKEESEEEKTTEQEEVADDGTDEQNPASTRSLFDRFLDAVASSLVDDEQPSPPRAIPRNGSDTIASLLRGEDKDESSDDDDDMSLESKRSGFRRTSPMSNFRFKRNSIGTNSTSYARALSSEAFFQRSRILPVSSKHGFPPSKDPDGTKNRALVLSQARSSMAQGATGANALRLKNIIENQRPIDGILPAGWLEKHVHALPSVLLVVTSLSPNNQAPQNQHLIDTLEHLKYNLASKRECHIHVVCLVEDPNASVFTTDAWITLIRHRTDLPPTDITLLSATQDLQADMPTTPGMRQLHTVIRDASMMYYLQQARRAKKKHAMLGHERQPTLLPLAIRYCFKIGVFYEFQLKHEKSIKFFAEAYRHVQMYYRFLLSGAPPDAMVNPLDISQAVKATTGEESANGSEGIEVALADASDDDDEEVAPPAQAVPPREELKRVISQSEAPEDMKHQCRAVADWLNFKLLQAGFLSTAFGETDGLLAASWQWRRHAQVFLRKEDRSNPSWNHWSYVAHQRLVMSQLAERHPPQLGEGVTEEILLRCSPWRNYLAATEAVLLLDAEIRKELSSKAAGSTNADKHTGRSLRQPNVGGLGSEGLAPKLLEESEKNLREKALQLAMHAIELFEQGLGNEKDEGGTEEPAHPFEFEQSGARLYYVAGGILLSLQRHQEAAQYLEKAALYCAGWKRLESSIRRLLVECYDAHMPPETEDSTSPPNDATILDSYFSVGLSPQRLIHALDNLSESRSGDRLKWHCEYVEESDTSLPFSFSVTFPNSTHATAGDTVTASVLVKSNLSYAVHVDSVAFLSKAGEVEVPYSDMLSASQVNDGTDGCVIVQPNGFLLFSTDIDLPRTLTKIASDNSGKGSENEGNVAKGHSVTSARPRIAGITSGAGARLVSEGRFGPAGRSAQWSKSLLGGLPLVCDGMRLLFSPVYDEVATEGHSKLIELFLESRKLDTAPTTKKTPFEENNYIESAWSRPNYLPLSRGPRCLRVMGPMPNMIVTNLTDPMMNGKALEGTVNRILFKLEAGQGEHCYDVKYRVKSSTILLSSDGTTTRSTPEDDEKAPSDGEEKVKTDEMRTPVIVCPNENSTVQESSGFGYALPLGWKLVGTGQSTVDAETPVISSLAAGESTYICLELYRPPRQLKPLEHGYDDDSQVMEEGEESEMCQTDFDIAITYRQSRPNIQQRSAEEQERFELSDPVLLEHTGSVVWESPISAEFPTSGRVQRAFPSGSRHPSNYVSGETPGASVDEEELELALINGERTSTRCVLHSNVARDGLELEIARVMFEEKDSVVDKDDAGCELRLLSCTVPGAPGVLYAANETDGSRKLTAGAKFGLAYTVEPRILDEYIKGSVSSRLGVICVDWMPVSIPLPDAFVQSDNNVFTSHGPLRMAEPSRLKFRGPRCYIENSPFETVLESLPPSPRVATPFEMSYRISNKTGLHQKLSVLMSDQASDDRSTASEGVLVSGLVHGDIYLAPFETQILSYTALATRAGKTTLPALSISCDRYQTWVVRDEPAFSQVVFVLP